jgi:hypothetical protein
MLSVFPLFAKEGEGEIFKMPSELVFLKKLFWTDVIDYIYYPLYLCAFAPVPLVF